MNIEINGQMHTFRSDYNKVLEAIEASPYFTIDELECRCKLCRGNKVIYMPLATFRKLEQLRALYGPIPLSSGSRCKMHPEEIRKKNPLRQFHCEGLAFDISVTRIVQGLRRAGYKGAGMKRARAKLIRCAYLAGFWGIGFNNGYMHTDDRGTDAFYLYKGAK